MYQAVAQGGSIVYVAGKAGRDETGAVVPGVRRQAILAVTAIEAELRRAGLDRRHIVRIRFYVVDMRHWPEVAIEMEKYFSGRIPPSAAVGVTALADPAMLIEIEVEATTDLRKVE